MRKEISATNPMTGPQLWEKAKRLIPGGGQLLSKRPEMFAPEQWPAYYKQAKGAEVWDLDGNRYLDMSIMGMGCCVLGYADEDVNRAVKRAVDLGSMCTLNCHEEVELAERLITLHPWAEGVRFARTGGEACAIAVRIARAAAQKDKVAFCGYHGWSDWYLSANLSSAGHLDGHLLPGLEPGGVPKGLKDTAFPFEYGSLAQLEEIGGRDKSEIGVIIMEVARHRQINVEFLKGVRQIADRIGAVLIFDEVTTGFRFRPGAMHVPHGVRPDMVVLGKAMGNGIPIAAVLGTNKVMKHAQETFISSTFWTERLGFAASLEVIRKFEIEKVGDHLVEIGNYLTRGLREIFAAKRLNIEVAGLAPSPVILIKEENPMAIKTLFTQEMLKRGFLASTTIFLSLSHTREIIDQYLTAAGEVFGRIAQAVHNHDDLKGLLEGPPCHSGFKRLV